MMKKSNKKAPLKLNTETVRLLNDSDLRVVAGGSVNSDTCSNNSCFRGQCRLE